MSQLKPQDWQSFWTRSTVTSMEGGFENNYDGEVLDFWAENLKGNYETVIDLACGNGALTWIADQQLNGDTKTTSVYGIDFSDIDPFKMLGRSKQEYPMVSFIGNTPIESLPFDDNSVDIAISQWGLEYSNLERTIPELGRVLKPESKMCFVCHHDNSDIVKSSKKMVEKYHLLLEEKVHDKFLALDALYNTKSTLQAVKQDPQHSTVLGQLNRALHNLQIKLKHSTDSGLVHLENHINDLTKLFADTNNITNPQRKKHINFGREDIEKTVGRISDLFSSALTEMEIDNLVTLIRNEGFTITHNAPLIYSGSKTTKALGDIGIAITATKSA